ncbi:MAG TPA: carbohydrate ABC transporter permease [Tepidisphaeraceae bacterium]|nr:carbohydrate ABC transporter permease [Tepidisphaeraceae bacterium]
MKLRTWQIWLSLTVLIVLSIVFAMPFIWMASTSFKVEDRVQSAPTQVLPEASFIHWHGQTVRVRPGMMKGDQREVQIMAGNTPKQTVRVNPRDIFSKPYFDVYNYTDALASFPFLHYLRNTLIISASVVLGTVLSCSLVAYGLACVNWRGREILFWIMLSTMMLPGQVTMIPLFLTYKHLGWINTFLPLIVPAFFGNAFFIFLLRQFYRSVPRDLMEAARLDGCNDLGIWWRLMLPLSRPALAVVALFTFIATWNDFLGPLIYLNDDSKYTLSLGLAMFQGQYNTQWGQMMAMSLLMTLPIILLFFFTQKSFIQGVKLSGIKG